VRGEDVVVAIEVGLEVAGVMAPLYAAWDACVALQVRGRIYCHQSLPAGIPLESDFTLPPAESSPNIL
jgi:hypothetical protein